MVWRLAFAPKGAKFGPPTPPPRTKALRECRRYGAVDPGVVKSGQTYRTEIAKAS